MITFRVGDLAGILGVHRNTVTNWIRSRALPAQPGVGKKYFIEEEAIRAFLSGKNLPEEAVEAFLNQAVLTMNRNLPAPSGQGKDRGMEKTTPTGSVLVVGGGIAGIQATLDLAESGYRVHLVEKSAGIGGRMAQLDKTFPTNDCAM
ncbi:DNA binding domain-containing protein, excisionase family [Desulfatibacillum alkenivorans DSM 16219]|jgi:excisionase family DNA binding protein|uniref:DNA binding domain-containing protein, excisionase family n=1 Tax=Desulfatibacillum alkenivorans DSM 16219 TaxID=1121393 RepID=A0A1M6YD55_9BACT|nr:DNA binding domain-containing protein, excisionase family [Desulfatibacillum alkenivorans DSM 16219]